jgi:hypothetical protein
MRAWIVAAVVVAGGASGLAGCETFGAPYEKETRPVEGCDDAVKHLRACCPRFNSYVSCQYLPNSTAQPDLSERQSRCIAERSCAEIERDIVHGDRLCGFAAPTRQCR